MYRTLGASSSFGALLPAILPDALPLVWSSELALALHAFAKSEVSWIYVFSFLGVLFRLAVALPPKWGPLAARSSSWDMQFWSDPADRWLILLGSPWMPWGEFWVPELFADPTCKLLLRLTFVSSPPRLAVIVTKRVSPVVTGEAWEVVLVPEWLSEC